MIKVRDRVIAKKDSAIYKEMNGTGIEFEIVEITDSLIKVKNSFGYGIISINELSQFDIVDKEKEKEKEKKEKWSKWNNCYELQTRLYGVSYKTKGRQTHVILNFPYEETTSSGRSFAHPDDEYSLETGIMMAISNALKHKANGDVQSLNRTYKVNPGL